jgi:hypothetical protein
MILDPFVNLSYASSSFCCPSIVLSYAQMVFEDTFLMIHDADGEAWADALRYKMHQTAGDPISPTELTGLLRATDMPPV